MSATPFPLGAHPGAGGVRFAVASRVAERVELCLIDSDGGQVRVALASPIPGMFTGWVEGVTEGQRYGYRVHGPWDPRAGLRCNPHKLLLDPYARRMTGALGDPEALTAHADDPFGAPSTVDSLGHVPLSVVTGAGGPATGTAPRTPWVDTVVYELHVGSYTATHPGVAPELRGTYLGLAQPVVIEHLAGLGITAVELLPVHAFLDEPGLRARGMRNHWGYSTACFLAPHPGYAAVPGEEVAEFRTMVGALHAAGIEVILDVVYNHTCEVDQVGPSLSLRGLDAAGYYLHGPDGALADLTGCGNTVDPASPDAVRLVMDSLRYWAGEMGVDGFRFDLASVLGRPRGGDFDPRAPLLTAMATDPALAEVKLVAEPWDATGPGYQVGGFGPAYAEWNDHFRDGVREFWRGANGIQGLAYRLTGSSDVFARGPRRPWSSVNFVTAHDGFTIRDLVTYARKHNEANGEQGRDGTDNNRSVNHGVEGESAHPVVRAARERHVRALLATLALATGTPMLLAGDELGHTQGGNNNAYCAPAHARTPWALDWDRADTRLLAFTRRVLALRASVGLRRGAFLEPAAVRWFDAHGVELTAADWHDDTARTLQAWIPSQDQQAGRGWLLVLHGGAGVALTLAPVGELELVLDNGTATGTPAAPIRFRGADVVDVAGCTLWALRTPEGTAHAASLIAPVRPTP